MQTLLSRFTLSCETTNPCTVACGMSSFHTLQCPVILVLTDCLAHAQHLIRPLGTEPFGRRYPPRLRAMQNVSVLGSIHAQFAQQLSMCRSHPAHAAVPSRLRFSARQLRKNCTQPCTRSPLNCAVCCARLLSSTGSCLKCICHSPTSD